MTFDLTVGMEDASPDGRTALKPFSVYYTEENKTGKGKEPIIHIVARDATQTRHVVHVEGFRPFFFISEQEWCERRTEIKREAEKKSSAILDWSFDYAGLDKENRGVTDLVKIVVELPKHVGKYRDYFDRTWEADVPFGNRFMLSTGIKKAFTVSTVTGSTDHDVAVGDIGSVDAAEHDLDGLEPRVCMYDIEVSTEGIDHVPDPEDPRQPLTAVTAYDNYSERFWTGVVRFEKWTADMADFDGAYAARFGPITADEETGEIVDAPVEGDVEVFDEEKALLTDFLRKLSEWKPDVLSGWNSDQFDTPYFINRCFRQNLYDVRKLSPTQDIRYIEGGAKSTQFGVKGIQCWDLMTAYKKSQIHSLKDGSLDGVAQKELGVGKEDVDDLDRAWKANPQKFVDYSIRDVEALVGIEASQGLISMYDALGEITGSTFERGHHNSMMIDDLMARSALKYDN